MINKAIMAENQILVNKALGIIGATYGSLAHNSCPDDLETGGVSVLDEGTVMKAGEYSYPPVPIVRQTRYDGPSLFKSL